MLPTIATALLGLFAVAAPAAAHVPFGSEDLQARAYEPRAAKGTLGAKCRFNAECKEFPTGARASCNSRGVCDFVCLNGPILVKNAKGNGCIPNASLKKQCSQDSQCASVVAKWAPSNSDPVCLYGQCTFACSAGYHKVAGKCYKNMDTCAGKTCAPVAGGDSFCDNGECVYRCNQGLGYTLYTNSDKSAYKCINTGMDVDNCGSLGNACNGGYNGVGAPVCLSGTCSVDCTGHGKRAVKNGQYYCTGP